MTDRKPPPLVASATADVLRRHAPFDAMGEDDLAFLASGLKLRYFAKDAVILSPQDGRVRTLFIIQRGAVQADEPSKVSLNALAGTLTDGEVFPVGALIAQRPTTLRYKALKDTFCYEMDEAHFAAAMARSPEFHAFCTKRLAALLASSRRGTREAYSSRAAAELTMSSPLRNALRHSPVTLPESASVRQVLELMQARRIGSIVLTGDRGRPTGIFTQTDVLNRVALAGQPLDRPVAEVMTREPARLEATSAESEAAHLMARRGFRHVMVMDGEAMLGVISERDLFGLQRLSLQGLRKDIGSADGVEALAFAAREVRELGTAMLAQGVAAEQLTQFVSALNDAVTGRAIELALRHHDVADIGFCWMGLGSEGRNEQTLATDQDNAIIFPDGPGVDRAALRRRLLPFADEVNRTLDACGFPLCKGDIMARNPAWCLGLNEWISRFGDWIENHDPQALLNATIFFDFRPLRGDEALVARLREFLLSSVKDRPVFLRQMAANAILTRPPLGLFGDIVVDGGEGGTIDLKKQAARVFVDCARIMALGAGVPAVSTAERLRAAGPRSRMSEDDVGTAVDAFQFIQMLRLRAQDSLERGAGASEPNRLDPDTLNSLDRRILREALRQARKLQTKIALESPLCGRRVAVRALPAPGRPTRPGARRARRALAAAARVRRAPAGGRRALGGGGRGVQRPGPPARRADRRGRAGSHRRAHRPGGRLRGRAAAGRAERGPQHRDPRHRRRRADRRRGPAGRARRLPRLRGQGPARGLPRAVRLDAAAPRHRPAPGPRLPSALGGPGRHRAPGVAQVRKPALGPGRLARGLRDPRGAAPPGHRRLPRHGAAAGGDPAPRRGDRRGHGGAARPGLRLGPVARLRRPPIDNATRRVLY